MTRQKEMTILKRCVLLASVAFCLIYWVSDLHAALLKDIRLGEHQNFTRVVFEFDQPPPSPPEIVTNLAELRVIFGNITPDLVRKITVKQSHHVTDVQIWMEDNQLSAVFNVDASFTHGKIRSLSAPPRLLLDIQWKGALPPTASEISNALPTRKDDSPGIDSASSPYTVATVAPALTPATLVSPSDLNPESPPPNPVSSAEIIQTEKLQADSSSEAQKQTAEVTVLTPPKPTPEIPASHPYKVAADAPRQNREPHRLQYYLVIGLVLLTIAILLLLVVMLLTKYKWINDRLLFKMDNHLKEQQDKIDTINGRIKEQLKHYEKA